MAATPWFVARRWGWKDTDDAADIVSQFQRFGGRLHDVESQGPVVISGQKPYTLYPVCHQGTNRSQTLYRYLEDTFAVDKGIIEIGRPHGALEGCDPHPPPVVLDEDNYWEYLHVHGAEFVDGYNMNVDLDAQRGPFSRGFFGAFGRHKIPRIGEEMAQQHPHLNPLVQGEQDWPEIQRNRFALRKWMDDAYWRNYKSIHRIFFVYCRGVSVAIKRLLENRDFGGCVNTLIVAIDKEDSMNTALRHAVTDKDRAVSMAYTDFYNDCVHVVQRAATTDQHAATNMSDGYEMFSGETIEQDQAALITRNPYIESVEDGYSHHHDHVSREDTEMCPGPAPSLRMYDENVEVIRMTVNGSANGDHFNVYRSQHLNHHNHSIVMTDADEARALAHLQYRPSHEHKVCLTTPEERLCIERVMALSQSSLLRG